MTTNITETVTITVTDDTPKCVRVKLSSLEETLRSIYAAEFDASLVEGLLAFRGLLYGSHADYQYDGVRMRVEEWARPPYIAVIFEQSTRKLWFDPYGACGEFARELRTLGYRPIRKKVTSGNTHSWIMQRMDENRHLVPGSVPVHIKFIVHTSEPSDSTCRYVQVGVEATPVMEVRCGEPEPDELAFRETSGDEEGAS